MTEKTLGQIAHETGELVGRWERRWSNMTTGHRAEWEAIAEAVIDASGLRQQLAEKDAESGWQPIETAPKDGSYVLIANSHGAWIAKWHPVFVSGFRPSDPWSSVMLNHDHIEKPGRYDKPTHWMPLPPPPEGT